MAAGTKVQLRLGDRVVSEVFFHDAELRIGRMKENDLVINNLAVSRFHAVLRRVGAGFEIEDLGSENGTFLSGVPVRGRAPLELGAEIAIGKHVLTLQVGADDVAATSGRGKSDVWDAAQTYFAPARLPHAGAAGPSELADVFARHAEEGDAVLLTDAVAEAMTDDAPGEPAPPGPRAPAISLDMPDPEGRFAFGEDELAALAPAVALSPVPAEFDVSAREAEEAVASAPAVRAGETALFDFAPASDLGLSEPSLARAAAERAGPAPAPAAESLYAGLIVARGGQVERVVPLRGAELVVGRAPTCDLVLATAGISRRHARFVREGEDVRVLDLGSANGLRVNGENALERQLQLGDVVAIDDYTLTYVLDREPMEQAVRGVEASAGTGHLTVLHGVPLASIPERDLIVESDEEESPDDLEKELEIAVGRATLPPRERAPHTVAAEWVVEVVLATDGLPAALRDALAQLSVQDLRLPAELRLRRR